MLSWIRSKRVSMKELGQPNCPITIYATGISARIPSFYLTSTYSGAPPLLVVGSSRVLKLSSFDRSQDFMLLLAMGYALLTSVLPTRLLTSAGLHFGHALAWTVFHTLGLGLVLHAQSTRKFLVRHFLQHYHYPARDLRRGAVREAFASWKVVYNLSMCMSYGPYFLISLFQG
jgi:hypothetical protein